jgi:hypothetical protein
MFVHAGYVLNAGKYLSRGLHEKTNQPADVHLYNKLIK